jgi:hypothetical protein
LNEFAADEIEKAGAHIHDLFIEKSVSLCRLIARAKKVSLKQLEYLNDEKIHYSAIETYTEFRHLKNLTFRKDYSNRDRTNLQ